MSVEFCVSSFDSNVRSCMPFTMSVSCLSAVASCLVVCPLLCPVVFFYICCSSNLKLRMVHCSLVLALSPSQSSMDQSGWVAEGARASNLQYMHCLRVLVQSCLGVSLTISILLKVYGVSVLHIILFCHYWVKSIPPVRPSSPGLPRGMSTFGLGLGRKVRHSMAFIPC